MQTGTPISTSSSQPVSHQPPAIVRPQRVPRLGDTALRYMAALYDPRGVYESPWVPRYTVLSEKQKTFVRGSFATGTTGYGYVLTNPIPFNDLTVGVSTSATSVGGAATALNAFTNQVVLASSNGAFASTALGTGPGKLQWRPIASALYVKYAGTELNRGGDMVLIEEPNHTSLNSALYNYNTALSLDGTKRVPVTTEWQHVSWVPIVNASGVDETAWTQSTATSAGAASLACIVNSAGASQPFDFEVYTWSEFQGSVARAPSISFNDPIGFDAIIGAASMFQQLDSVLGLEGFVKSVEAQLNNQSLPRTEPPNANFVGLLPFLPKLAELALPLIKGAAKGALRAALPKKERQALTAAKAARAVVKATSKKKGG